MSIAVAAVAAVATEIKLIISQQAEEAGLNPAECRFDSYQEHQICSHSPIGRGGRLKPGMMQVRILPRVPVIAEW